MRRGMQLFVKALPGQTITLTAQLESDQADLVLATASREKESQSGEIAGLWKQLKEEMEGDLSKSQKREAAEAGDANIKASDATIAGLTSTIRRAQDITEEIAGAVAE